MNNKPNRALRPDAQAFDEIRITTIPRYKTSGLSGNEWRTSAKIEFLRKGKVAFEEIMGTTRTAANCLGFLYARACDDGHGYFAGIDNLCDQEGCAEEATVTYKMKKKYCREGCSHDIEYGDLHRKFCARHSKRGDCGMEDSDENYEIVEGNSQDPRPEDVKQSAFGGVIKMENI